MAVAAAQAIDLGGDAASAPEAAHKADQVRRFLRRHAPEFLVTQFGGVR